jgi:hypothetical protein
MRPNQSKVWAAVEFIEHQEGHHTNFSKTRNLRLSTAEENHSDDEKEDISSDSDVSDDESLSSAVQTMKLRRNKQRKLHIQVVVDNGTTDFGAPAANRVRPGSAPSTRAQQKPSTKVTRHYAKEIENAAPASFPNSDKSFSFEMHVSSELTWKRLAQIAAHRYGTGVVTGAGRISRVRHEGEFIPINVRLLTSYPLSHSFFLTRTTHLLSPIMQGEHAWAWTTR